MELDHAIRLEKRGLLLDAATVAQSIVRRQQLLKIFTRLEFPGFHGTDSGTAKSTPPGRQAMWLPPLTRNIWP
jgi:hypothetical protein